MSMRRVAITALLLGAFLGGSLALARESDSYASKVEAQDLFIKEFAGDPSEEVRSQFYTFPPGAVLPWHIHPDAHEIAYVIERTFTFERAGAPKVMKAGDADCVAPNVVHRGMNLSNAPVKLFVVRIKPKNAPLVQEVPEPKQ